MARGGSWLMSDSLGSTSSRERWRPREASPSSAATWHTTSEVPSSDSDSNSDSDSDPYPEKAHNLGVTIDQITIKTPNPNVLFSGV